MEGAGGGAGLAGQPTDDAGVAPARGAPGAAHDLGKVFPRYRIAAEVANGAPQSEHAVEGRLPALSARPSVQALPRGAAVTLEPGGRALRRDAPFEEAGDRGRGPRES